MSIQVIDSKEEFEDVLNNNPEFFLLKHSLTCPISAAAKEEYEDFASSKTVPCYALYVQQSRDLSNLIAKTYEVKHESPQVLFFKGKQVYYHDSHSSIKSEQLKRMSSE